MKSKKRTIKPKMVRTQFEDSNFPYKNGGELELKKEYSYKKIENFANENGYEFNESGIGETVGRHILILDHPDRDEVLTFILVGSNSQGFIYKLIYSDFDKERYATGG